MREPRCGVAVLLLALGVPAIALGQDPRGASLPGGWDDPWSVEERSELLPQPPASRIWTTRRPVEAVGSRTHSTVARRPAVHAMGRNTFVRPSVPERRSPASADPGRIARATAMSALVPGSGQLHVGQKRGWVYLTLEVIAWGLWIDRRSAGADARAAYRDFAWDEGRIQDGSRVDGDFDFYENLSNWERSGAWDVHPGSAGVQPESDVATYNGAIWRRAEGLYLPGGSGTPETDPGYIRALGYYADFAYADGFLWDWRGTGDARESYAGLIRTSDARYREATNVLGAIIANHVISAVDAFLSTRGMAAPVEARILPRSGVGGTRWTAHMSFQR